MVPTNHYWQNQVARRTGKSGTTERTGKSGSTGRTGKSAFSEASNSIRKKIKWSTGTGIYKDKY